MSDVSPAQAASARSACHKTMRRAAACLMRPLLLIPLLVSLTATGCFGSFGATNAIYSWNKGVSGDKFIQTLVFYGLVIIPVYEVLAAGDVFIFNVIEFWTGDRLFADATLERKEDGTVVITNPTAARDHALPGLGPDLDTYVLSRYDAHTIAVSHNDVPLGVATLTDDGMLRFVDEQGSERSYPLQGLQ